MKRYCLACGGKDFEDAIVYNSERNWTSVATRSNSPHPRDLDIEFCTACGTVRICKDSLEATEGRRA